MAMTADEREWRQQAFLDWLCTIKDERNPSTQDALAAQLEVSESTLQSWKKDPAFLARWETQYRRTIGSPDRMKQVMDALFETAIDRTDPRQVQAAKEYRQAVEGVSPQQINVVTKPLRDMTDEEFDQIAAEYIAREKVERDAP